MCHRDESFQFVYDKLCDREDWQRARSLLKREFRRDRSNHWLLTEIGMTYYEKREYREALAWETRALKQAPRCPLVLWNYAGTLDMLERKREAIAVWKSLLRRGAKSIASGECGEGKRHAESLLNDARYRIGKAYRALGRESDALRYLRAHMQHRKPGLPSVYRKAMVVSELKKLEARA